MDLEQAIAAVKTRANARTRYEGQEPYIDELLVAEVERLRGDAIRLHRRIFFSDCYAPDDEADRKAGWQESAGNDAKSSAERLVELGAFERHPDSPVLYRPVAAAKGDRCRCPKPSGVDHTVIAREVGASRTVCIKCGRVSWTREDDTAKGGGGVKDIRCTACRAEFESASLPDNICACPSCGSRGLPMSIAHDVDVRINWHELRILCMWATNWADDRLRDDSRVALASIIKGLMKYRPSGAGPLTLVQEVKEAQQAYPGLTLMQGGETIVPPRDEESQSQ